MSLESTSWTTTRAMAHNAPFAGLAESTPSAGGVTQTGGVALVVLGLGLWALWSEIRKGGSRGAHAWP
jgi:hypothetical protein